MPAFIALLRGINVGGNRMISMAELKKTFESLGYANVRTLLNSGNVVFDGKKADAKTIESAVGTKVMLRTAKDLERVIERNPFDLAGRNLSLLLVAFLAAEPDGTLKWDGPEETHLDGRHLYLYYPNGAGRSKLTNALIEKQLGVSATARNWNTITKLLTLAHPNR